MWSDVFAFTTVWKAQDTKFLHVDKEDFYQIRGCESELSLCWEHMLDSTFTHVVAHLL